MLCTPNEKLETCSECLRLKRLEKSSALHDKTRLLYDMRNAKNLSNPHFQSWTIMQTWLHGTAVWVSVCQQGFEKGKKNRSFGWFSTFICNLFQNHVVRNLSLSQIWESCLYPHFPYHHTRLFTSPTVKFKAFKRLKNAEQENHCDFNFCIHLSKLQTKHQENKYSFCHIQLVFYNHVIMSSFRNW